MKRILFIFLVLVVYSLPAQAFETGGFKDPYGVTVDPRTGDIYVSNMNGPGDVKSDNGFISKLSADGNLIQLRFIDGIQGLVELHAPKGMAIIGNFLYVADIDAVRVFDIKTAKSLFTVNFGDYPVKHFYGMTIGSDGALYVTDGPANTVYRINVMQEHRVTVFAKDEVLGEPHAVAWFPLRQVFLVGGWKSGTILAFNKAGSRVSFPEITLNTLEGIAVDMKGHVYISSTSLASIFHMSIGGAIYPFVNGVDSPVGIAFQLKGGQILVISYRRGSLMSYPSIK